MLLTLLRISLEAKKMYAYVVRDFGLALPREQLSMDGWVKRAGSLDYLSQVCRYITCTSRCRIIPEDGITNPPSTETGTYCCGLWDPKRVTLVSNLFFLLRMSGLQVVVH